MHSTYRAGGKGRSARATLTVLAALAAAGLAYRFIRASSSGLTELLTSIGTAALVIGALTAAWCVHVRRINAQHAEWTAARQRRQETLLDGDEDRELWDSVEPKTVDEDTCAFGINVVVLNQRRFRYPEAG